MTRFHITKNGMPDRCTATVRPCPLGDEEDHFYSIVDAATAIEARSKAEELPKPVSKTRSLESRVSRALDGVELNSDLRNEIIFEFEKFRPELEAYVDAKEAYSLDSLSNNSLRSQRTALRYNKNRMEQELVRRVVVSFHSAEDLPEALQERIWTRAWDEGHSSGYNSVSDEFSDNLDFARDFYEAGKQSRN